MAPSPHQPPAPLSSRIAAWVVGIGVGSLLLLAACLKLLAASSFVAVVAYLMPRGWDGRVFRVTAGAVVAWEIFLGLALVFFGRRRLTAAAAIGTIAVFSAALLYLATKPGAPSCSCFGPMGIAHRAGIDLWLGLTRNTAILVALGWLWTQARPSPARSDRPSERHGSDRVPRSSRTARRGANSVSGSDGPRAFSLIELLVVIAIVLLILSFIIPALRGTRRQAQVAATLSTERQLLVGLSLYAAENNAHLPFLATRGDPFAPVEVQKQSVAWNGYFRDQSQHWHTLVNPDYIGLPQEALAIPDSLISSGGSAYTRSGFLLGVRYHLTHTAFAAPALWVEPTGENLGIDRTLLRGMRLSDLVAPSSKGLLSDVALGWLNPVGDPFGGPFMPVGWGDGSASQLDAAAPDADRFVHQPPLGANPWPVWATLHGFNGRDRD